MIFCSNFRFCDMRIENNFFVRYNRLILFRSNLWHSFGSGFGKDTDDCMLFQKIKIGYA